MATPKIRTVPLADLKEDARAYQADLSAEVARLTAELESAATPSKVKGLAGEYDRRAVEAENHAQRLRIRGRTPEEIQLKRLEVKLLREAAEKVRGLITPPRAPDVEWCPMNTRNHTLHELIDERLRGGKYECRLCHWEPEVPE